MGYQTEEENAEYEMNWEDVGFVVPEKTKLDVEVMEASYKWRENSKAHGANVTFKIIGIYDPELEEKLRDKKLFENFTFSQSAGFNVKKFMKMADIEFPKQITKSAIETWCEDIVGKEVGVSTRIDTYQGDKRTKIAGYFIAGTGGETERKEKEEEDEAIEEEEEKDEAAEEDDEEEEEDDEEEEEEDDDEEKKVEEPKTETKKKTAATAPSSASKKNGKAAPPTSKKAAAGEKKSKKK